MKLSLPSHETIRVELFKEKAHHAEEYRISVHYAPHNIKLNQHWKALLQLTFFDLNSPIKIPSSSVIVAKQGLPLMFNTTQGSNVTNRFKLDPIQAFDVIIEDQVVAVEEKDLQEKTIAERMIERSWTEIITRMINIKNDTGRLLEKVIITVTDDPTNYISLVSTDPAPDEINLPKRKWTFALEPDQSKTIKVMLQYQRREKIELPEKRGIIRQVEEDLMLQQADIPNKPYRPSSNE